MGLISPKLGYSILEAVWPSFLKIQLFLKGLFEITWILVTFTMILNYGVSFVSVPTIRQSLQVFGFTLSETYSILHKQMTDKVLK